MTERKYAMKKLVVIACSVMTLAAEGALAGDPVAGEKKSKPRKARKHGDS